MNRNLNLILNLNKSLMKRIRKNSWYYILLVLFFTSTISVMIAIPLFTHNFITFESENERYLMYIINMYFLIVIDLTLLFLRNQSKTNINKSNFLYFPIKDSLRLNYTLISCLIDLRILPYLATSLIFFFYLYTVKFYSILFSILSIVPIMSLYLFVTFIYTIIILFIEKMNTKKNIFSTLISMIPISIAIVLLSKKYLARSDFVIINKVGEALYQLNNNSVILYLVSTMWMLISLFVLYLLLFAVTKNRIL